MKNRILPLLIILLLFQSTQRKGLFQVPFGFPQPVYNFSKNPLDSNKAKLGRAIFYDPILSADSTISCASCHSPFNAFAHTDHDLSHGIGDQIGNRNAPSLVNLAWHSYFMWDGAIKNLDMQPLAPIHHPKEMGSGIRQVLNKLERHPKYRSWFFSIYNSPKIESGMVLSCLAQFQLTLISSDSKYDKMRLGKLTFTEQEKKGYLVFLKYCNTCHTEPLFTNGQFSSNGLPLDSELMDAGRGSITGQKKDSFQFKVPTLRNLSFSYPYMHDGRFKKLHQVLNHYAYGVDSLKPVPSNLKKGISLTAENRVDLVSFLLTLNDTNFVFDKFHGFPKK